MIPFRKIASGVGLFLLGALVAFATLKQSNVNVEDIPPWLRPTAKPVNTIAEKAASEKSPLASLAVADHKKLFNNVRVLCWIMTSPENLNVKAKAVKDTWARKCNKAVYMSSVADKDFPAVGLSVEEGHDKLWPKSRKAWYYIYQNYADEFDWFLKADDDTFVILENLRYFASSYDPDKGHYFGRRFRPHGDYNSGGAGYVISRGALKKLGPVLKDASSCPMKSGAEDAQFSVCLHKVGVSPDDTRDGVRERFHPFSLHHHLIPGSVPRDLWYWQYVFYHDTTKEGPDCCSDLTISFHYIAPNQMHELYFYVYRLHPYGWFKADDKLPPPKFVRPRRKKRLPGATLTESSDKHTSSNKITNNLFSKS